jgi:hypothetical protein
MEEHGEVNLVRASEADSHIFTGEDLLIMGGPTIAHGLSPEMKRLIEAIRARALSGPYPMALAFDTRINWPKLLSGSAADKIAHNLEEIGCRMPARPGSFIVLGGEGPLADGEEERAAAWVRAAVEQLEPATVA